MTGIAALTVLVVAWSAYWPFLVTNSVGEYAGDASGASAWEFENANILLWFTDRFSISLFQCLVSPKSGLFPSSF